MVARAMIARAFEQGADAKSIGLAFAAGYQCALRVLFQTDEVATLAVTEAKGAHPRNIETVYDNGLLTGTKTFATCAPWATRAFVLARVSNGLVMASVPIANVEALPPTPFAADVPHGVLRFHNTPATVLPGDGYSQYAKPFRTLEDIYVFAALLGHARHTFTGKDLETFFMLQAAITHLSTQPPLSPDVHLALAALIPQARELLTREPWIHEAALFSVAERVRQARTEKAHARLP